MTLILSWVVFPLVLAALGAGWGTLVERAGRTRVHDALLIPVGLAAVLVVAGTLTAFSATAPAAVPAAAVGGVAGLVFAWPGRRFNRWALLAAAGVLIVYGAPVLLSGSPTFTGFVKLDDTGTWFNVIDHIMSHGRSVSSENPSTFSLVFTGDVGASYPLGAFVLPGVARGLVGVDVAWVFQPYLAVCGAALALSLFALMEGIISSAPIRSLVAFGAAQAGLLYGYSLWGGIKELTAAFLLATGVALTAAMLPRRPSHWRELIPLAVVTGALIQTLGIGAGGWVVPAFLVLGAWWIWRGGKPVRAAAASLAVLAALSAAFIVPIWAILGDTLSNKGGFFAGLFSSGQTQATKLGNLIHPLSAFQLAGIWPVRDFRLTAPTLPSVLLIGLAVVSATAGLWVSARRRRFGPLLYALVALGGCAVVYFSGGTPWVTGKALAIASPALLAAAMMGGAILLGARTVARAGRIAGGLVLAALLGGVLWSNALGYGDATLAPYARLAELSHMNDLVAGKGPTFINQYEVYADRHFLRAGEPVEPAEYRTVSLPLSDGARLTKAAAADIDSFPLSTLEPYRSIVTPRSPVESRPPSIYHLVWQGRYYQLWQRAAHPANTILAHIPLGESKALPYCGQAEEAVAKPLCSVNPVATPPCARIRALAAAAAHERAELVAYQRPAPIVARGDQTLWPGGWLHDLAGHTLIPTTPGEAISHIAVASAQRYELWLGGSFTRGFEVSVDGNHLGRVKNQLMSIDGYVHVGDVFLTPGVHTVEITYPSSDLTPGSAENEFTSLSAIVLQPQQSPRTELLSVNPAHAGLLCGRPLDWIELIRAS